MEHVSYGFGKDLDLSTDQAIERVTAALQAEGFGILTRIDVHEVLKKKLGLEVPPYVILGACNPTLASGAIAAEPQIGLLLPCNVLVKGRAGGGSTVSIADPAVMGGMTGNGAVGPLMADAEARLRRVISSL
jgi:uncharacterized protein (DUF302 family)